MAPLPVIEGVYRIKMNWDLVGGITPVNVFHVFAAVGTVDDIVGAIDDAFGDASRSHQFHCMVDGATCTQLEVIPLDGTSATTIHDIEGVTGGSGGGDSILELAGVVSFHSDTRGPAGRGRIFCGPVAEAAQADGILGATSKSTMADGWAAFLLSLDDNVPEVQFGVASYAHEEFHHFTSIRVDGNLGTQRRRLLQKR